MNRRELFCWEALRYLGAVVQWGDLDCSDLVARARMACGVADGDERVTHTAQRYHDIHLEAVLTPKPGDLGFYGKDATHVAHVVIALWNGTLLSADGAARAINTRALAEACRWARVQTHLSHDYYHSLPFIGWRNHVAMEESNV